MGECDAEIGAKTLYQSFHFCKSVDTVMDEEDLAAPFGFIIDDVAYVVFIENHYFRLYRLPVRRRVLMMLRSRAPIRLNWSVLGIGVAVSVSESTVVRICLSFFCRHAEFLFLIDDHNAEVLNFTSLPSGA